MKTKTLKQLLGLVLTIFYKQGRRNSKQTLQPIRITTVTQNL